MKGGGGKKETHFEIEQSKTLNQKEEGYEKGQEVFFGMDALFVFANSCYGWSR
jgi:hypothetical protein